MRTLRLSRALRIPKLDSLGAAARLIVPTIALGLGLGYAANSLAAESGVGVGTLSCKSVPGSGINLIIHSNFDIDCVFEANDGTVERYKGRTGIGIGLDLNISHDETFHFAVVAANFKTKEHHLAGSYAGGKAAASIGVGGGGQILVGGFKDSIGLKPSAIQGKGFGIAAGLSYMHLEPHSEQKEAKTTKQ